MYIEPSRQNRASMAFKNCCKSSVDFPESTHNTQHHASTSVAICQSNLRSTDLLHLIADWRQKFQVWWWDHGLQHARRTTWLFQQVIIKMNLVKHGHGEEDIVVGRRRTMEESERNELVSINPQYLSHAQSRTRSHECGSPFNSELAPSPDHFPITRWFPYTHEDILSSGSIISIIVAHCTTAKTPAPSPLSSLQIPSHQKSFKWIVSGLQMPMLKTFSPQHRGDASVDGSRGQGLGVVTEWDETNGGVD